MHTMHKLNERHKKGAKGSGGLSGKVDREITTKDISAGRPMYLKS